MDRRATFGLLNVVLFRRGDIIDVHIRQPRQHDFMSGHVENGVSNTPTRHRGVLAGKTGHVEGADLQELERERIWRPGPRFVHLAGRESDEFWPGGKKIYRVRNLKVSMDYGQTEP